MARLSVGKRYDRIMSKLHRVRYDPVYRIGMKMGDTYKGIRLATRAFKAYQKLKGPTLFRKRGG